MSGDHRGDQPATRGGGDDPPPTDRDLVDKEMLREMVIDRSPHCNTQNDDLGLDELYRRKGEELLYAPGYGVTGAFVHQQDERWESSGDAIGIKQFARRLDRLATGRPDVTALGPDRVVFDFSTLEDPLWMQSAIDGRETHFRGEGCDVSTVFLSQRGDEWTVTEFCIRLAPPPCAPSEAEYEELARRHSWDDVPEYVTEIAAAVGDLVAEIGAPVDDTLVWTRPISEDTSIRWRYIATGRTPHIAAYEVSIPAVVFLEWLAALRSAYDPHPTATGSAKQRRRWG